MHIPIRHRQPQHKMADVLNTLFNNTRPILDTPPRLLQLRRLDFYVCLNCLHFSPAGSVRAPSWLDLGLREVGGETFQWDSSADLAK